MGKLTSLKGWILDLDGVLWRGADILPGTVEFLRELQARRLPFVLATNNATATPGSVTGRLREVDVRLRRDQVVTSAQAAAEFLEDRLGPRAKVFAIGEAGLRSALVKAGLRLADRADGAQAVVVGLDRKVNWHRLTEASRAIRAGAMFLGTNPDLTFPSEEGLAPGNGALLAFLQAATGRSPQIVGKPEPFLFQTASRRLGTAPEETAVVGDRIETDIVGGRRAGMATILVLTGVTRPEEVSRSEVQPDWIFHGLRELLYAVRKEVR